MVKNFKIISSNYNFDFSRCRHISFFQSCKSRQPSSNYPNEAFNHWSNYQAKTIKKTTLETELYTIEIELAKLKDTDNALKTELLAKKAIYEQEIAQYKQEEITLTAKAQEAEQRHLLTKEISTNFGNALIFLQIGILLSSLTTLSKIKYYWYIGSISGIIGFSIFITSYYRNLTM